MRTAPGPARRDRYGGIVPVTEPASGIMTRMMPGPARVVPAWAFCGPGRGPGEARRRADGSMSHMVTRLGLLPRPGGLTRDSEVTVLCGRVACVLRSGRVT